MGKDNEICGRRRDPTVDAPAANRLGTIQRGVSIAKSPQRSMSTACPEHRRAAAGCANCVPRPPTSGDGNDSNGST
jgi:hypothetical protein